MRSIPKILFDFLKKNESCRIRVYDDARPNYLIKFNEKPTGQLTVGYGHVLQMWQKLYYAQEECDKFLNTDVLLARYKLYKCIDENVINLLTDNQYAAILSFVFNCGANKKWKIWAAVNEKKWNEVILCLKEFCHDDGKVIAGLQNRRNAEIDLWNTP
jgi:lysozyme